MVDNPFGVIGDVYNSVTGGDTRSQADAKDAAQRAAVAGQAEREALAARQGKLDVSGMDPASIKSHDNWDDWDHQRLYEFRDTLKIEDLNKSASAWQKLGEKVSEIFADLESGAQRAVGEGWQGKGAGAALASAKPMQEWGKSFGDSVKMTGLKVQEAASGAEQTKGAIQPPPEFNGTRTVMAGMTAPMTFGLSGAADAALQMKERQEEEKAARAIVQNVYTPIYQGVDGSTPTLPPPVDPLAPPPPPAERKGGQPDIPTGSNPNVSGNPTGSGSVPSGSSTGMPPGGSASVPGGPAGSGSSWAPSGPGSNVPNMPQVPTGPTPSGPGGPGGGGVGVLPPPGGVRPGMPGGGAGAGGGRAGGMGGAGAGAGGKAGAAGGGMGAGGRAGTGGLGGGAAGGSAGGGAAGAAGGGAGARGGMGGMGAGGGARGGQGGDEDEHNRPSWLEEHDDVWLNDMPRTAPPVFGE